jgi:hypothetical protein
MIELQEYDYIKDLYLIAESNKDILTMLDDFNNNINHKCNNCINHSKNINKIYSSFWERIRSSSYEKLNLQGNYETIKNKFDKLSKIKTEFELINKYHDNIKLEIAELLFEISSSKRERIRPSGYSSKRERIRPSGYSSYQKTNIITTLDIEFKNHLEKSIEYMEQNNINIQIYNLENSIDNNYEELLLQLDKYNKYNSIIQNYEDIIYNTKN